MREVETGGVAASEAGQEPPEAGRGEDGAPPGPRRELGLADIPTSELQAPELGDWVALAFTLV